MISRARGNPVKDSFPILGDAAWLILAKINLHQNLHHNLRFVMTGRSVKNERMAHKPTLTRMNTLLVIQPSNLV